MSRPALHAPISPPGDEELAALYNQVLIGFAEESPTSEHPSSKLPSPGEREYDPHYKPYADDGGGTLRSMHPAAPARPTLPAHPASGLPSSPAPPRSLPTPGASSPTSARPVRRLPPIPGSNATLPPPPPPPPQTIVSPEQPAFSFPEPAMRPKHSSGDS
ncbi:hypothetical protein BDW22DRAFT_1374687 [Trametopsis cervina]|nr:hypothetical protein BDW22DRAFT_1374687 [Trametopsis cervina]